MNSYYQLGLERIGKRFRRFTQKRPHTEGPIPTFGGLESDTSALPYPHLVAVVLVHDGLDGHAQVTAHVAFFADDGDFVDERDRVEEIAEIDEATPHHPEPGESIVERVTAGQRFYVVIG